MKRLLLSIAVCSFALHGSIANAGWPKIRKNKRQNVCKVKPVPGQVISHEEVKKGEVEDFGKVQNSQNIFRKSVVYERKKATEFIHESSELIIGRMVELIENGEAEALAKGAKLNELMAASYSELGEKSYPLEDFNIKMDDYVDTYLSYYPDKINKHQFNEHEKVDLLKNACAISLAIFPDYHEDKIKIFSMFPENLKYSLMKAQSYKSKRKILKNKKNAKFVKSHKEEVEYYLDMLKAFDEVQKIIDESKDSLISKAGPQLKKMLN